MVVIDVVGGKITLKAGREGPPSKWVTDGDAAQKLLDYHILEAIDNIGQYSLGDSVWDLALALSPLVRGTIVTKAPPLPQDDKPSDAIY